jgi:hypothetical protein
MSLNFTEEGIRRLPAPIVDKLQALIDRVRAVTILKGAFATAALTIGAVIAIMMVYAAVPFLPDWVGYLGSLLVLGVLLYSGWRYLFQPLSRKLNLADIARLVEQRHPELQERISTSVELLASDDPEELKGSEQLIRMVVKEAITDVVSVRPEEEFTRRKAKPFIIAAAALVAVLVLSFIIWPKLTPRLFARVVAPYANIGNMYAGMLKVTPGDQVVLKGDPLNIQVNIDRPRVRRAELRMQHGEADPVIERMTRSDESDTEQSVFAVYFPTVTESFTYRVRSMKAETGEYTVTVVEPPAIEGLTVTWDFPSYTGLADITRTNRGEHITAPVGTHLTFKARYNKKVKFSTMMVENKMVGEGIVGQQAGEWQVVVKPQMDAPWKIPLEDQYGHTNRQEERMITAVADRVPEITIQKPEDNTLRLQPTELLPIDYFVQEDYGLSALELQLDFDGQKQSPVALGLPTRLAGSSQPIWTGRAMLDLAALKLDGVRQVRAHLLVRDNLPGAFDGPQEGASRTLVIDIDRSAQSLAQQAIEQQKRDVEEALRQILERLHRARESSEHAPNWVRENDGLPDWLLDHLKRGHKELSAADAGLKDLAEQVVETPYASMASELADIAEKDTTTARNAIELIQLTDIKGERLEHAEDVKEHTQIAINRVAELLKTREDLSEKAEALAELTDLAKEEFQLANEAQELAEDKSAEPELAEQALEAWKQEQQQLANELGDLLKEDQQALAEQMAKDAETASELAQEATELSERQEQIADLSEQAQNEAAQEDDLAQEIQQALQELQEQIGAEAAEIGEQLSQLAEDAQAETDSSSEPAGAANEPPAEPETGPSDSAAPEQAESLSEASEALEQASESARDAAEDIGSSELADAIEHAEAVSEQLQQASEALNPSEPEASPNAPEGEEASQPNAQPTPQEQQVSEEIQGLMAEQEAVQDALAALEEGNVAEALAALQEAVQGQVEELAEAADAFAAQQEALDNPGAENLAEQGAELAGDAAEALAEAGEPAAGEPAAGEPASGEPAAGEPAAGEPASGEPAAGEPAAGEPATGEPASGEPAAGEPASGEPAAGEPAAGEPASGSPPSAEAAAAAGESLAQAAEAFGQLEELLAGQAEQLAAAAQPSDALADGSQLGESLGQAAEAAAAPSAEAAAQAAEAAAQAMAEMANAAAQSLGMQAAPGLPSNAPGQPAPGQPGELTQQPGGTEPSELGSSPDVASVQMPEFLARMGLSTADWIKMRALGANDVEVSAMADIPEEYRELVSKYFREVARQSVKK